MAYYHNTATFSNCKNCSYVGGMFYDGLCIFLSTLGYKYFCLQRELYNIVGLNKLTSCFLINLSISRIDHMFALCTGTWRAFHLFPVTVIRARRYLYSCFTVKTNGTSSRGVRHVFTNLSTLVSFISNTECRGWVTGVSAWHYMQSRVRLLFLRPTVVAHVLRSFTFKCV
jgi:hypothetical protein